MNTEELQQPVDFKQLLKVQCGTKKLRRIDTDELFDHLKGLEDISDEEIESICIQLKQQMEKVQKYIDKFYIYQNKFDTYQDKVDQLESEMERRKFERKTKTFDYYNRISTGELGELIIQNIEEYHSMIEVFEKREH